MKRRSLGLLAGALVVGLTLTAAGAASEAAKPRRGGTILFGADQEPRALNTFVVQGSNQAATSLILNAIFTGAYQVNPKFDFVPQLLAGPAKITTKPFTITYTIKKNARWNDGVPVSAADFIFTWQAAIDEKWNMISRRGYEDIARAVTINRKKVRFVFKKPFAPWRGLFGGPFPAHALRGEDLNRVWFTNLDNPKTNKPISNGPFQLGSWRRGSQLTIVRNPKYWGKPAYLNSITFRFVPDTQTQAQQIRGRELDVIYPQPQLYLADLRRQRGIKVQSAAGPVWEHIDFNLGFKGRGDPALRKLFIRKAIAHGINRDQLVKSLYKTISPKLRVLHNPFFMNQSPFYKPFFNVYKYNPARAEQLLRQNGCRKGTDGIYSCGGQKLSFRFTTTAGNQLRELAQTVIQQQLKRIGIDLNIANGPSEVVFGPVINNGNYDLFMFAWVGSPDPGGNVNIFACPSGNPEDPGRPQNRQGYCNAKVTRWLEQTDVTLNQKKRFALFNQAAAQMAKDVPLIPLFQKPTFLAHRTRVMGLKDNPTSEGPLWNAERWAITAQ